MPSVIVIILLASVDRSKAQAANHAETRQATTLFDRTLQTSAVHHAGFDDTTLGKPGHLVKGPGISRGVLMPLYAHRPSTLSEPAPSSGGYLSKFCDEALQAQVAPPVQQPNGGFIGLQTACQFRQQKPIVIHALGSNSGLGGLGKPAEPLGKKKKEKLEVGSAMPGRSLPAEKEKFHRWIREEDPLIQQAYEKNIYIAKTPEQFLGTRKRGQSPGSSVVQFTLPGKDNEPKILELMQSAERDNPSFGAVMVKLPVGAVVFSKDSRLVVRSVESGSGAANSRIRSGDIIRAVSLPDAQDKQNEVPWWQSLGQVLVPDAEEGMVILDGKSASQYDAALKENRRVNGNDARVVFIIERPVKIPLNDQGGGPGLGFPAIERGLIPERVPIPIPVPVDDDFPPRPNPPSGPGGYQQVVGLAVRKALQQIPGVLSANRARGQVSQQALKDPQYITNVGQAMDQLREDHQLIPSVPPGLVVAIPDIKMEIAQFKGISFHGHQQYTRFWNFFRAAVKLVSTHAGARSEVLSANQIGSKIRIRWRLLFTAKVTPQQVTTAALAAVVAGAAVAAADAAKLAEVEFGIDNAAATAAAATVAVLPPGVTNAFSNDLESGETTVDFNSIYELDPWSARIIAHTLEFRTPSEADGLMEASETGMVTEGHGIPALGH